MGGCRITPHVPTLWGMEQHHQDRPPDRRGFRIWVQGRLDEHFSDGLEEIEQQEVPSGTVLIGRVLDQSRLHSVLDHLRRLGIEVLRFEVDRSGPTGTTQTYGQ